MGTFARRQRKLPVSGDSMVAWAVFLLVITVLMATDVGAGVRLFAVIFCGLLVVAYLAVTSRINDDQEGDQQ